MTTGAPAKARVRKTVTVVFSDVSGSTALGEQLDPESLQQVMSRYFDAMRTIVERHGGTVEKFIGDAVMAVFGIPRVHEDDALRAVRAAAEMREALGALNDELRRERGIELAVRIGVNTGEVVAGDPASGHGFATGDAVNVAARLEQAAQPGEVLLGETTYGLVRDAVEAEPLAPLALKGKGELVPAHRLLTVDPGAPGRARRLESPFVGRARELKLLYDAFGRTVGDGACQLFTLLGAAGVGKSRLAAQFLDGLGAQATVLRGRCLSYGEGITYWPLAEALRAEADPLDADRITGLLAGEDEAEAVAARVAGLLGPAPAAASAEEAFWAVRKLFEALARKRTLVVVLDDVHWAEPSLLDLVEHVADLSREAPMLLLLLTRPELLELRPGWGGGKFNATSVLLEPLSADESTLLVENLLGENELPEHALARIVRAAEGNPLFLEELVAMLIEQGVLAHEDGRWVARSDLEELAVPPTIQALVAARLDQLGVDERTLLGCASIEGRVFHRGAVSELVSEDLRPELDSHLRALVRKELLRPDRPSLQGEDAFRFRNQPIQDAAYDSLPKESRAELHGRFAGWLEQAAGDRVVEVEEFLGYHLEQAYRYRAELGPVQDSERAQAARAATWLGSAGRRSLERRDLHAAENLLSRAVSLLPERDAARPELTLDLAAAYFERGDLAEADRLLTEVIEAAGPDRPDVAVRGRLLHAELKLQIDPDAVMSDVLDECERTAEAFEQLGDELGLARAWFLIGKLRCWQGQGAAGVEALERAAGYAERAGAERERSRALEWLCLALWWSPLEAETALARCEEIPGQRGIAVAFTLMATGALEAMLGRFDTARQTIGRARETIRDLGALLDWASTSYPAALVELLANDPDRAAAVLEPAISTLEGLGETGYLSTLAAQLAEAEYRRGRYDEAERLTIKSAAAAARDDLASQVGWRCVRAKVLARGGEAVEAERLAREALELVAPTDDLHRRGDTCTDLAEVLRLSGRVAEAVPLVEEAVRLHERKGNLASAAQARAMLEELNAVAG